MSRADLEKWIRAIDGTVETLVKMTGELSDWVRTLNGSLRAVSAGPQDISGLLVSQLGAVRDLLIAKGLVTAEEVVAFAQIAELERMLQHPPNIPNSPDTAEPTS